MKKRCYRELIDTMILATFDKNNIASEKTKKLQDV